MTLEEHVAQWPKRYIQEGLEQDLAYERTLLFRQAASGFCVTTAKHLSGTLAGITDPDRLADIGDWLVRCDAGDVFPARVRTRKDELDRRYG